MWNATFVMPLDLYVLYTQCKFLRPKCIQFKIKRDYHKSRWYLVAINEE